MSVLLKLPFDVRKYIKEFQNFKIDTNGKIINKIPKDLPVYTLLKNKPKINDTSYYRFLDCRADAILMMGFTMSYGFERDYTTDEKRHFIKLIKINRSGYTKTRTITTHYIE